MDKTMRGYRQIPVWLKYLINALLLCTLLVLGNHIIVSGGVNRAQKAVILQIGIYILLAVSLNVATGYLGQLPLGHAGFMAVGAYAAALLWKALPKETWAVILGLLLGGLVAAVFGIVIGIPALRVLVAATSDNARIIGREDLGVLAPGKTADVAGWHRDLLNDVDALSECSFVMKEGTVYKNK